MGVLLATTLNLLGSMALAFTAFSNESKENSEEGDHDSLSPPTDSQKNLSNESYSFSESTSNDLSLKGLIIGDEKVEIIHRDDPYSPRKAKFLQWEYLSRKLKELQNPCKKLSTLMIDQF